MTLKDRIRSRLRWESGKTYIGKREGWPEAVDSPVSVPAEEVPAVEAAIEEAAPAVGDGKDAYIETPEGFDSSETLIDRFTDEEPENVDLEAEEASRKQAKEAREELLQSMGELEAERAGIDKYAQIPDPEPVLFGREKEEAEQAKIEEAIRQREEERAAAEEELEPPAEEQISFNLGAVEEPAAEPAPEIELEIPEIGIPELDLSGVEGIAAEEPAPEIEIPELDLSGVEGIAAEEPAPVEEPAAEESAPFEIDIPGLDIPIVELGGSDSEPAPAEEPVVEPTAEATPEVELEIPELDLGGVELDIPDLDLGGIEDQIKSAVVAADQAASVAEEEAGIPTEEPVEEPEAEAEEPAVEAEPEPVAEAAPAPAEEPAPEAAPAPEMPPEMSALDDNLHFSEQEQGIDSAENAAVRAAESVTAANFEAAVPSGEVEDLAEMAGGKGKKKKAKKEKKGRDGEKKSKGLKDKLLRRRNKKKEDEEAAGPTNEDRIAEGLESITAGIESGFLATKGQRKAAEAAENAAAAEAPGAEADSLENLEIPETFKPFGDNNDSIEFDFSEEVSETSEAPAQEDAAGESKGGKPKVRRRRKGDKKEDEVVVSLSEVQVSTEQEQPEEDVAIVEEIKQEVPEEEEISREELEAMAEIIMDEADGDKAVTLEEAEAMALERIRAKRRAEAESEERKRAQAAADDADISKIKIPFYLKNNEKKREAYIKKQLKKIKAKARKEADAIKKKELAIKKAEEAKEAKKKRKEEKKAAKPELKKQKKEAKAAKKEQKKEKKAAKKEKKREKKAIRKEKWAKKPKIDKFIIRMFTVVAVVVIFIVGWMYLPGVLGKVFDMVGSIPDNIKANMDDKEFQKELAEVNPRDEELLRYIENTVNMQPMESNVLQAFGIAGAIESDMTQKKYVATWGDDGNPGTEEEPYKTVQKGINSMHTGGVLYVGAGTYNEALHISLRGESHDYITIMSNPSSEGKAVLDGKGLGDTPLVTIEDSKYLTFCNIELQNVKTAIEVKNSKAIILAGLNIHDLRAIGTDQIMQEVDEDGNVLSETVVPGPKAYGIKVIGDTPTATRSILVYYNTIEHINRGAGVHVEGNAEHINLFANKMMSIGGCGIEYIGATGMCQQSAYDAPRDCTIKANSIGACKAKASGGYGILVDSARSITMSENITYRCDVGYGIMSALPYDQSYQSDEIELTNNLTACDYKGGIFIGSSNGEKGYLNSVKVMNNTCLNTYDEDTGSDFRASNVGSLVVRKNIFCNAKASGATMWVGDSKEGQSAIIVDGNIYATPSKPGTAKFIYGGKECSGYMTYKKASGEQTGYYTSEDYTTLCPNLLYGDYSFMNYGIQVGATVIDPKTIKDKEEE